MSQFPPPSTPAERPEASTAPDPAMQAGPGDRVVGAQAAETPLDDVTREEPVTMQTTTLAPTTGPAPILDDGPEHDTLTAAESALSGPPAPHVAAALAEVRTGAHVQQVNELVGAMFQVPTETFFDQHPQARELVYRAVAEEVTAAETGSDHFEAAMDVLEAGFLRAGRSWSSPADAARVTQARRIASDLTAAAAQVPVAERGPVEPDVARARRPERRRTEAELELGYLMDEYREAATRDLDALDAETQDPWDLPNPYSPDAGTVFDPEVDAGDYLRDETDQPSVAAQPDDAEVVKVFCAPHCPACDATVRSLTKAGVQFEKIELESLDPQERADVVAGHQQAPVVQAPGVGTWDGHRPTQIERLVATRSAPELDPEPDGPR